MAGARTVAGRIVEAVGTPIDDAGVSFDEVTRLFPRPEQLLAAPDDVFSMPQARRDTIRRLAAAVLDGDLELHVGADPAVAREQLLRLRGVGPWTADYVVMRGLGHPDMFLDADLGVRHALAAIGVEAAAGQWLGTVALVRSAPPLGESLARRSNWKDHSMTTSATTNSSPNEAELVSTVMDTPVGPITIVASDRGVRAILWPDDDPDHHRGRVPISAVACGPDHPVIVATVAQLGEYFAGEREEFDLLLDPVGTDFQQSAWMALRTIPYGTTVSYGEQAARMGDRRKARAVGAANGRNPISIVVPCHRVVGSNGALTGFAGGIATKAWLLDHEQRHTVPGLL